MTAVVLAQQAAYGYTVLAMELLPDPVPLLLDGDPRAGSNVVVGTITGCTSHERRDEFPWRTKRLPTRWTRSTFIATVGAVPRAGVQQYSEHQQGV